MNIAWEKLGGLLPVLVLNEQSKPIMCAYMDKEALGLTISTGLAHYYSRTRAKIWQKGESSGHIQRVLSMRLDCDCDTLLMQVAQTGAACHTGRESCFYFGLDIFSPHVRELADKFKNGLINADEFLEHIGAFKDMDFVRDKSDPDTLKAPENKPKYDVLDELYHTILKRKLEANMGESYVASLFAKGHEAALKKVAEEAGEFIMAAKEVDFAARFANATSQDNDCLTKANSSDKPCNDKANHTAQLNDKPDTKNDEIMQKAKHAMVYEAADLLFHMSVALCGADIHPQQVLDELARRFGIGGLKEKASRAK